ncbi:MAG: amidohydrolase family protein [Phaeodactylibacter sp.]|nr:amidohydrolase family protein [Phaeodactylibacter sp.]
MEEKPTSSQPVINCHTHIFTGDHVPPHLARTFVWWPFYFILSLPLILWAVKSWNQVSDAIRFSPIYRAGKRAWYKFSIWISRTWVLNILQWIISTLAIVHVFYILYDWASLVFEPDESVVNDWILLLREKLEEWNILFDIQSLFLKGLLVAAIMLFFKSGRNFILFILKRVWSFFQLLPGKMTTELIERYILLCRFTLYKHQRGVMAKLKGQYPAGTGFVVLPMDMKYMEAGHLSRKGDFYEQMKDLAALKQDKDYKDVLFPFVFIDPRRIREEAGFFQYSFKDGQVSLEDCFLKEYMEGYRFSGFKIYPALGYYPFEEELLPLWKYAADRGLPITTHCIRGTIYYRGRKKREWDEHPVFEELKSDGTPAPLLLPERKNEEFQLNFTHPMNYLCLLEEPLLRKLVGKAQDNRIRELFGYHGPDKPLDHDLSQLKICIAHFGGEDQWSRYLELDRYNYSLQLIRNPDRGIDFLYNRQGAYSPAKLEQVWKYTDWYSIICSIMLQYENVYSDISYILHNEAIFPLLKQTLRPENEKLRKRVLFGTDFYVVRNHKSDKQIVTDTLAELDDEEFNLIARENPRVFLGLSQETQ